MLTRRAFTTSLASVGVTMLSVHRSTAQSLPTIRLGNAAGIIDPQLIFMTMGQHPKIDYYKQEGCALDIINMSGSGQTMQAIIAGHVETSSLAPIAYLPVFAKNPNVDVVYVYAWLRSPHWGVAVKPDSPIKSLQDLKGKNIGIRNKGDTGYFGAVGMLKEIGMDPDKDVEWISVDQGGPAGDALYRGRVDAMAFWDGGFARIETAGFKLRYLPNSPGMQQLFGQAYCIRRSDFKKNRDVYVRFFRAMAKSTVFAYADTDLAIKLHWDLYPETKPKGKSDQEAMADARVVVNSRRDKWMPAPWQSDKRFGAMNADEWRAQLKFLGLEGTVQNVDPIFSTDIIDDVNNFDRDKVLALVKTLST
ncbi:ABC transporter substrate-binding protein [Tardiphaga sp.]|uniref:ABC transporter substrate-binding protein n=1 Tax=Tardiphaga sp. TaxID=1926292 RepID=UPI0025EFE509|nr:ABC transporter substrate-binding protein [Tardiphaga sp.]